ncbi:MAG TPA: FAD-binding oxidoreductase [Allosphingosinicella sp.]|jgi:FAD/FMN-containing dehydrogenase
MPNPADQAVLGKLAELLGPKGFSCDAGDMEPWLVDWRGRWRGTAAAMLMPATTQEVQALVSLCAAAGVVIVPQGGNTSMVGGATPPEAPGAVLLSLRRMNRIRLVSPDDNLLVAEAGSILSEVHDAAAAAGRRFPLSLGAKGQATIGGLVSTNAGGTQVLRFGTMRSQVLGVEAVLPDGSLWEGLSPLKKDNRGYDVGQLLIGGEGTLGVVTAASLRLVAAAGRTDVAWVGLRDPTSALRLLRTLEQDLGQALEGFELVPDSALRLVLKHIPGTRAPLAGQHRWHVLLEAVFPEGSGDSLERALGGLIGGDLVQDATLAATGAQAAQLWRLRETIAEAERLEGPALKHDISVPVAKMPAFIGEAAAAVEARNPGTRVIAFGHLGDGNVHFNVIAPPDRPGWMEEEGPALTAFVHDMVTDAGGSISAEHGIGQMKRAELARTAPPARIAAQRAIKAALDPQGIMNPGKLLPPL